MAPDMELLGVLITKIDDRKNYYKQTMETLHSLEDIHVFENTIHVDSAVEWAQDASRTVITYKRASRSAKEYMALAKEVDALCQ
jgi:chromosome partitioning protein